MKKFFLMAVCAMAMCVITLGVSSCTKEIDVEELWKNDVKWMESYWGKDYALLIDTWVEEESMNDGVPLYVEIRADRTYKSNGLVTSVGHEMSSGDWCLYSNDMFRNIIEFHADYRQMMHLSWADDTHNRLCVRYTDDNRKLEGVATTYWVRK